MSLLGNIFKMAVGRGEGIQGCIEKAEAGDAKEQFCLGIQYERGQFGLPQDYFQSAKWYRKAAEQGHAGAQLYLGLYLAQGKGVKQNLIEAFKWIDLARRGNAFDRVAAQDTLNRLVQLMTADQIAEGMALSFAFVPATGKDEELRLLQKAVETESMIAQYELAMFYTQADFSPSNTALQVKWMTLAAQQGFPPAQLQLGSLYALGDGVPSDFKKSFEWNYKAAAQGYSDSQVNVSDAYHHGTGVQVDLVQAYKWLKVAIDQGEASYDPSWGSLANRIWDTPSMEHLMQELLTEMTPSQISEGQTLSKAFRPAQEPTSEEIPAFVARINELERAKYKK
jgi:TPR repeat protein